MLYPLKFQPVYKDYLWGGRNLTKLGRKLPPGIIAESWEVSTHPDGVSVIANGQFKGKTLTAWLEQFGGAALGTAMDDRFHKQFPLLVKLIDAKQQLSVQVHPDDEYARRYESGFGKNEMWYIVDAQPGAYIIYDFTPGTTRTVFEKVVQEGRIGDCLQQVPVAPGDAFDIPAGTVHGIGAGIIIAEIQQSSNLTYRLYDYDRVDQSGNKRPLHIDQALAVADFDSIGRKPHLAGISMQKGPDDQTRYLVANQFFAVESTELNGTINEMAAGDRFYLYLFLKGSGTISYAEGQIAIQAPETAFIPANLGEYSIQGNLQFLKAYLPDLQHQIIEPLRKAGYDEATIREMLCIR